MSVKLKEGFFTVLFMIAITAVFISILTFVYLYTKERIAFQESLYLKKAVLYAAGVPVPTDNLALSSLFDKSVKEKDLYGRGQFLKLFIVSGNSGTEAYVFEVNGAGLWGTITAVVGLSPDLKTMKGITFIRQNETPGLGARISENWFQEQFRGKHGTFSMVPEKESTASDQFQAITGATITSTAVKDIVNKTFEEAPTLVK